MQQSYAVSRLLLSDPVSPSINNQMSSLLFTMFIPTHKVETRHVWICVAVSDALSQRPIPSVRLSQAIVFALCVCSRSPLNQTFPSNKGNSHGLILLTPSTKRKLSQPVLGTPPRLPVKLQFQPTAFSKTKIACLGLLPWGIYFMLTV